MSIPHQGVTNMSINISEQATLANVPAPLEPSITKEQPYTDIFFITPTLAAGKKSFGGCQDLNTLIKDQLTGCANVDLYKLEVKFKCTASGKSIAFGVYNSNATLTLEELGGVDTAVSFTSNSMTYGQMHTEEIIIPDHLTRQIQPASSLLPGFKFYLYADEGISVWVNMYVKVHGPRRHRIGSVFQ